MGVEVQPDVAEMARTLLVERGLQERAEVLCGDIRGMEPQASFDLATLHNNIYYFPVQERAALLARVRAFLKPGGRLLLTTGCRGGSAFMAVLDLWGAITDGCGRLDTAADLTRHLEQAGFRSIQASSLLPGDSFYAFVASNP